MVLALMLVVDVLSCVMLVLVALVLIVLMVSHCPILSVAGLIDMPSRNTFDESSRPGTV